MTPDNSQLFSSATPYSNLDGEHISPNNRISFLDDIENDSHQNQSSSNSGLDTSQEFGTVHRRLSDLVQDYDWSTDLKPPFNFQQPLSPERKASLTFKPIDIPLPPLSQSALKNTDLDVNNLYGANMYSNINNLSNAIGSSNPGDYENSLIGQNTLPAPALNNKRNTSKRITSGKSRRTPTSGPKTRPAFVLKLWNMVNDPTNESYIQWIPDGQSFQVLNREQFEKVVLPKYFKHSNFSSFVRQLNMYGWHKVQDVTSGAMQSNDEMWQFKSPNFIRGREDLLDNIVRNKGSKGSDDEEDSDISRLFDELELIKSNQRSIADDLNRIRKDNELLWRECYDSRERHKAHSEAFEKILRFLASLYTSNQGKFVSSGPNLPGAHKQQRLLLPNLQELNEVEEAPEANQALSAIEDLISGTGESTSPNDPRLPSHHRISSISSADEVHPIISEANTPGSTRSSSPSVRSKYQTSAVTPALSKSSRNSSKVRLEEVNDEMGPPLTTTQNQLTLLQRRPYAQQIPNNQSSNLTITELPHGAPQPLSLEQTSSPRGSKRPASEMGYNPPPLPPHITNALSSLGSYNDNSHLDSKLLNNNHALDAIARNLDMQGNSLQFVHDWVQKLAPEYDLPFNDQLNTLPKDNNIENLANSSSSGLSGIPTTLESGPTGIPAIDSSGAAGVDLDTDLGVHAGDTFNVDDFLNNNELLDDGLSGNLSTNGVPVSTSIPGVDLEGVDSSDPQTTENLLNGLGLQPPLKRQKVDNDNHTDFM